MIIPPGASQNDRTWESAVQDINGMNSILTLLPVLTGKRQNVKIIASRILPASFVIAGIGAGRVLAKLQLGILLSSFDLYRNTVGDLTYPHDEYVNNFSPTLNHVPTDTPERHATGAYINHNPSETYMVEAWFQTQGHPSIVELRQTNNIRLTVGFLVYLALYMGETYLAIQNAAIGTGNVFLGIQAFAVLVWLLSNGIVQIRRGQGKKEIELNRLSSSEYRCFKLPMLGSHVSSVVLSFHLNNLQGYRLFRSDYEQPALKVAGAGILLSGVLDILATILIVGKTTWAYPWIGLELAIIIAKVFFCIEPLRMAEFKKVKPQNGVSPVQRPVLSSGHVELPLQIHTTEDLTCRKVCTDYIVLEDKATKFQWQSNSAGIWIGQEYHAVDGESETPGKFLALVGQEGKLGLVDTVPQHQSNQALQREFLAALAVIANANTIPSQDFLDAVQRTAENVKTTMQPNWYKFGAKDVLDAIAKGKGGLLWRKWF